jgi:hypothetical protein
MSSVNGFFKESDPQVSVALMMLEIDQRNNALDCQQLLWEMIVVNLFELPLAR